MLDDVKYSWSRWYSWKTHETQDRSINSNRWPQLEKKMLRPIKPHSKKNELKISKI